MASLKSIDGTAQPNSHLIFGYGSLVNVDHLQRYLGRSLPPSDYGFYALQGVRRCWNLAMDNRVDIPDYKYYRDAHTGRRPSVYVTFLNIRPHRQSEISGIVFRVSPEELVRLDQRERNYHRLEVSDRLKNVRKDSHSSNRPFQQAVWVYVGSDAAKQRYQQGDRHNTAVIARAYANLVAEAYGSLGQDALAAYHATTDTPTIPLVELVAHSIPAPTP